MISVGGTPNLRTDDSRPKKVRTSQLSEFGRSLHTITWYFQLLDRKKFGFLAQVTVANLRTGVRSFTVPTFKSPDSRTSQNYLTLVRVY